MATLTIEKDKAVKAYDDGNKPVKKLLETLFGPQTFSKEITERVKTWEDVLKLSGTDEDSFDESCEGLSADEIGYRKYKMLAAVLNEGWKPDWSNSNETKYWPWMKYTAGSGFSFHVCGHDHTFSGVGSRLCFKSRKLAEYAATQFPDIINEFFL